MKRSEALAKLKDFLEQTNVYSRSEPPEEAVLEFLEVLGMRPPYTLINGGEKKPGFYHEWELEDK